MNSKADRYHDRIIEETGLTITELYDMTKEKQTELKGLISEEGALFILASELGVVIDDLTKVQKPEMFIKDLDSGMKNIIIIGRIARIFELRSFTRNDGTEGYVLNFILEDKTARIRVVIWDDLAVELSSEERFIEDALIKIEKAYIKWSDYNNKYELHIPKWGKILFNPGVEDEEDFPKKIEKDWGEF